MNWLSCFRTAMMQDAKSAGYALKLPVAFIDDPIDMAEQAYATGTDSSGELLPKAGQQAANSSFFGHQSYAVTVPFTARQQQKNQINTDAYQHSLRQWQARQVRQAHVSADNSSLGHGNLVNSQRAQALTIKEVQGWLYTLATSQWEQTASPSTRVHESWWNTMKFGLLESLHEEANLVREYVQKPLLEGLESTLSGVSYIADELAPVFLNTPYTVSEGAALEELALGTARVAHFFGETAKNSALIRRIGLFGREAGKLPNYAAHNAADALRLKTTLSLQEAGILDETGKLTDVAVETSRPAMRRGSVLENFSVVDALTKDGSNIIDWEKLTTQSVEMPTGQRIQVHFYRNKFTGEVNYTHPDFKVKNTVDLFPNVAEPEPTVTPPYYSPY